MDVRNLVDALCLKDVDTVDEVTRFDQHSVEIHRVMRRDPQIAARYASRDRTGFDADRQKMRPAQGKAARVAASADPFDRARRARPGHDDVADDESLDRHVAALGQDERSRAVASDLLLESNGAVSLYKPGSLQEVGL